MIQDVTIDGVSVFFAMVLYCQYVFILSACAFSKLRVEPKMIFLRKSLSQFF